MRSSLSWRASPFFPPCSNLSTILYFLLIHPSAFCFFHFSPPLTSRGHEGKNQLFFAAHLSEVAAHPPPRQQISQIGEDRFLVSLTHPCFHCKSTGHVSISCRKWRAKLGEGTYKMEDDLHSLVSAGTRRHRLNQTLSANIKPHEALR